MQRIAHEVSADNQAFLARGARMLVGSSWVSAASGKTFDVYDPAVGEVVAEVPYAEAEDVDSAVAAAEGALRNPAWDGLGPRARGKLLWRVADLLEAEAALFAELDSIDNGMPFRRALANDLPFAIDAFRYYAGWCTKTLGQSYDPSQGSSETLVYTRREPVGVVGLITPWNYPIAMAALKLAPALAAGCTCILKPAEQTPLSALRLGELLVRAGLPPGVVNIVTGDGVAGAALASHARVKKIAFTGSTEVGRLIVAAAAGNLKKVSLELGGKSPFFILADADLAAAVPAAATATFYNSGQNCVAAARVYAHESVYDEVVRGMAERARQVRVAPGFDPSAEMGPLISAEHRDKVDGYVQSAAAQGARVVTGGSRRSEVGYFYEPTVLCDATREMRAVQEEIFGPVVIVGRFRSPNEIPAIANDTPYGLAASVWTRDLSTAHRLAKRIEAGLIGVNTHSFGDSAVPMGGYKQSGWGREFGEAGLSLYLETKTVTVQL